MHVCRTNQDSPVQPAQQGEAVPTPNLVWWGPLGGALGGVGLEQAAWGSILAP